MYFIKGSVALCNFGYKTFFAHPLIPWGHYTAGSKRSSPWYTCDIQVSAMSVHYFWLYEHFLSAIFTFCSLILLLEAKISEQPKYIFSNISGLGEYFSKLIFALKHWVQVGRFEYHEPYNQIHYYKVSVLFRDFCLKQQNQNTKN